MLMSLSATVAAIILLVPMPRWKRAGLLVSALPIALLCNVLRIAATAYCYEAFGSATGRKFAHDAAGWLMMPLALVLIGLEMAWFSLDGSRVRGPRPARPRPPPRHGPHRPGPLIAGRTDPGRPDLSRAKSTRCPPRSPASRPIAACRSGAFPWPP